MQRPRTINRRSGGGGLFAAFMCLNPQEMLDEKPELMETGPCASKSAGKFASSLAKVEPGDLRARVSARPRVFANHEDDLKAIPLSSYFLYFSIINSAYFQRDQPASLLLIWRCRDLIPIYVH
jgi:hypothetical protein